MTILQPAMAAESDGILVLQGAKPLARGNQRTVYAHPSDPDLLIKLPRSYWNKKGERWYKRLRSARSALQREAAEHAALKARSPADLDLIEAVRDWVTTDLGPGLAVGALRDERGRLAPTFLSLARKGRLSTEILADLERFIARIVASDLLVHDFKARNIVYAFDATQRLSRPVLVDGIGRRPDFALDGFSTRLSRRNKIRRAGKLRAEIDHLTTQARS